MQWSTAAHAGFSSARPWLPIAEDYAQRNVELQQGDPGSLLALYRDLLALRRARPTLSLGSYASFDAGDEVLGYVRSHGTDRDIVLLNVGSRRERLTLPPDVGAARVLLSTMGRQELGAELLADEAVLLTVSD
jgi:alpha-glucosidase